MKLESSKTLYSLLLLNVILALAWVGLFYKVSSLRADYADVSAPLSEESGKEAYVTRVSRQLRDSESERARLESVMVDKGNEAVFLEKIEYLGSLSATTLKISAFEERGGVLRLGVKSVGDFDNVYHFMRLLEALPLGVTIEKALLVETLSETGRVQWEGTFEVSLRNYFPGEK